MTLFSSKKNTKDKSFRKCEIKRRNFSHNLIKFVVVSSRKLQTRTVSKRLNFRAFYNIATIVDAGRDKNLIICILEVFDAATRNDWSAHFVAYCLVWIGCYWILVAVQNSHIVVCSADRKSLNDGSLLVDKILLWWLKWEFHSFGSFLIEVPFI